jgi:glycerophosphoryl diester phosphodiesterase
MRPWPYPKIFAHRLGGALAPENTLAGLHCASLLGIRAVECDVKLSADGVLFILHDDTLERTTTGEGLAGALSMAALRKLDAGTRHHPAFCGERLPMLEELAREARTRGITVNLEIKPNPGQDEETGNRLALAARALWNDTTPPLISSFSFEALCAAQAAAPELTRALLVTDIPADCLALLKQCGASALHADHEALTQDTVQQLHAHGYKVMAYTVNGIERARELLHWGVDMLCTDRPELLMSI